MCLICPGVPAAAIGVYVDWKWAGISSGSITCNSVTSFITGVSLSLSITDDYCHSCIICYEKDAKWLTSVYFIEATSRLNWVEQSDMRWSQGKFSVV